MSVHYKFKSALEYDTVAFDGLHITVKDLKNAIAQQKRIGRNSDFDLQVTNAQTKEVYQDELTLIPKNTSLLIARIPLTPSNKTKSWEGYQVEHVNIARHHDDASFASKTVDLASMDLSEDDKIMAMMTQSTQDYDPSNYLKIRGSNQTGQVPMNYRCYKCHQPGHWIKDCPLSMGGESIDIKKSTGIPRSFMVEVAGPQVQGAMMTPYGSYAVPALDHQAYTQKNQPMPTRPPITKKDIPDDLICSICSDLLTDAVMIPCCGNSFCDECIRSSLLNSDEHECPDCHEREISPGTLIPNRFLRNSVIAFKSSTGYIKRQIYKPGLLAKERAKRETAKKASRAGGVKEEKIKITIGQPKSTSLKKEQEESSSEQANEESLPTNATEKTIISEADSTDAPKASTSKEDAAPTVKESSEGGNSPPRPPGVSPAREDNADAQPSGVNIQLQTKEPEGQSELAINQEDRPGTPTVDEPARTVGPSAGILPTPTHIAPNTLSNGEFRNEANVNCTLPSYLAGPPPNMSMHHMHAPPPHVNSSQVYIQPPPQGQYHSSQMHSGLLPPPNYRIPPPGHSYSQGMYGPQHSRGPCDYENRQSMQSLSGPSNYDYGRQYRDERCEYSPQLFGAAQSGIIDDPLEAFNRMLAEKDERERRAKAHRKGRSYSRSSSRSYSRSPHRRRSPPRRRSRTRSPKLYHTSRSRSRSFSSGHHHVPAYREYSPQRRPLRYRGTPHRSPTRYRYKEMDHHGREMDRGCHEHNMGREYSQRQHPSAGGSGDYNYYDNCNRDNVGRSKWPTPGLLPIPGTMPHREANYYQGEHMSQHVPYHHGVSNRYPSRGEFVPNTHSYPPGVAFNDALGQPSRGVSRRMDEMVAPGLEQPLPPGEEPARYNSGDGYIRDWDRERERAWDREQQRDRDHCRSAEKERAFSRDADSIPEMRSPSLTDKDQNKSWDSERDRERAQKRERQSSRERHSRRHSRSKTPAKKSTSRKDDALATGAKRDRDDKDRERRKEKDSDREKHREKEREREATDDEKKKPKEKKRKRDRKEKDSEKKRKRKEKKEKREEKNRDKEKDRNRERVEERDATPTSEQKLESVDDPEKEQDVKGSTSDIDQKISPAMPHEEEDAKDMPIFEEEGKVDESESPENVQEAVLKSTLDIPLTDECSNSAPAEEKDTDTFTAQRKTSISPVDINPPKTETPPSDIRSREKVEEKSNTDDVLELYTQEQSELDKEMQASLPELSRWEKDEESNQGSLTNDPDSQLDKNKVTQDVLKRAENAIFAKAINAIRPIEIKRISSDRFKLYSGEPVEKKAEDVKKHPVLEEAKDDAAKVRTKITFSDATVQTPPTRISVKERLGCKVDDLDRIVHVEKHYDQQRTLSPFEKKSHEMRFETQRRCDESERNEKRKDRKYRSGDRESKEFTSDRNRDSGRGHYRRHQSRPRSADEKSQEQLVGRDRLRGRIDEKEKDVERDRDRRREHSRVESTRTQRATSRKRTGTVSNERRKRSRSRSGSRDDRRDRDRKKEKKQRRDKGPETDTARSSRKDDKSQKPSTDKEATSSRERKRADDQSSSHPHDADAAPSGDTEKTPHLGSSHQFGEPAILPEEVKTASTESVDKSTSISPCKLSDHRKIVLDEANFVPDYDAESEHEEDQQVEPAVEECTPKKRAAEKRDSLTDSSSASSSDESTHKRKKHKRHSKRKRTRRDSSSTSSESSSSDDDKVRKKKKHKKRSKKKKKSKHKS